MSAVAILFGERPCHPRSLYEYFLLSYHDQQWDGGRDEAELHVHFGGAVEFIFRNEVVLLGVSPTSGLNRDRAESVLIQWLQHMCTLSSSPRMIEGPQNLLPLIQSNTYITYLHLAMVCLRGEVRFYISAQAPLRTPEFLEPLVSCDPESGVRR